MPGWEKIKKFWKYSKSKPKWLRQEKISKFQSQNEKTKKIFQSSDWLRHFQTFSKYFQFNIEVNGISMYIQVIWESFPSQIKFTRHKNVTIQIQLSSIYKYKFN